MSKNDRGGMLMEKFSWKRFTGLCRVQIKELVPRLEAAGPVCVAVILVFVGMLGDSGISGLAIISISINVCLLNTLNNSFREFLLNRQGIQKISLPATHLEKYLSIFVLVFVRIVSWIVISMIFVVPFLLYQIHYGGQSVQEIVNTYVGELDLYVVLIPLTLYLFLNQLYVGDDLAFRKKILNWACVIVLAGVWLVIPDDIPETAGYLILSSFSLISLIAGYFCFKQVKPRYSKYVI